MITYKEVMAHLGAEPFRPFRISMASGRTYEVRHPEVLKVGKTNVVIFVPMSDDVAGGESGTKFL